MLTRLRAALPRGDAGVTLAELIVSMGLTTIIGALTLLMFVNTSHATEDTTDRTIGSAQARDVLEAWTSYLAVADGATAGDVSHRFEWLTSTDVLFHASIGNRSGTTNVTGTPVTMRLRLYAGDLVEEQFAGSGSYPMAPTVCRVLAEDVTASALFTAHDSNGNAVSATGTAPATSSACASLATSPTQADPTVISNLESIASVAIDFSVTDSRRVHTQEYAGVAAVPALEGAA